jgi:short-subunit dehydrogenase
MNLKGKRVLLTGATGGLGQALATELAKKGAQLALVGRDPVKLNQLKSVLEKTATNVTTITADLSEAGANIYIVETAKQQMGGIDILINNAGVLDFTKFEQQSDARIAQMLHTNVTAPIQLTHAVIADFIAKNQGHIVFVGSIFGSLGFPYFATYCASKFAIHGFSQSLRRELLGSNIGITYIAPRGIKTGSQMDSPDIVAKRIIQALEKEQQEVFIGQTQSFFAWLNGVCPALVNLGLKKTTLIARQFL